MKIGNCMVPTLTALHALKNHEPGECVYCEENQKIYCWNEEEGWQIVSMENKGLSMNLYDLNKSIFNQSCHLQRPHRNFSKRNTVDNAQGRRR